MVRFHPCPQKIPQIPFAVVPIMVTLYKTKRGGNVNRNQTKDEKMIYKNIFKKPPLTVWRFFSNFGQHRGQFQSPAMSLTQIWDDQSLK